jgi:serine/threonine protein phosphatase 1
MSKWRPRKEGNIYVIPDIHGAHSLLELILKRITPLRKKDKIVFLGDYIDRHVDSHKVLDTLIELKAEYGDQVVCLMGNHELMFLEGFEYVPSISPGSQLDMWLNNGGRETAYGYLDRTGLIKSEFFDLHSFMTDPLRLKRLLPQEHVDFMMSLEPYYEEGKFVFVHGGCHPEQHPSNYDLQTLCWDRSLIKLVTNLIDAHVPPDWPKVIVCGHSTRPEPIVCDKYMMLDIGSPWRLLVVEAHTREAYLAKAKKQRLVKYNLAPTKPKPSVATKKTGPLVRRVK